MSAIVLTHVDFSYESPHNHVFSDLSLVMDTTWRTGLVGRNGQGKSTLLQLIAGSLTPASGTIEITHPTVLFPANVDADVTTREAISDAIAPFRQWEREMQAQLEDGGEDALDRYGLLQDKYLSLGGYEVNANIEREFANLDMSQTMLDRPFSSLSGGEQTRALVVALFAGNGYFPLIDEPTNHLDMKGRQQLSEYLATKSGFLLVSHDRDFLDRSIDHVVSLNKSDVRINRGNYSSFKRHMDEIELHDERTRANIESEVKQLRKAASARRQGAASKEKEKYSNNPSSGGTAMLDKGFIGHRAAKQMKRALNIERRIDKDLEAKKNLLQNKEKDRTLRIETAGSSRDTLLTVSNLTVRFDGRTILDNVSLQLEPGARIAITGSNGSGKTTLVNVICGDLQADDGLVSRPGHITFSRAYQHPAWQAGNLREHLEATNLDETSFRQILGSFGVRGDVFERPLDTFSQGQLKKVDLARSMMIDASFLVWDEPMNYIDVMSREQIEQAILASQPTMLFIDHDLAFVRSIATEVIELDNGRIL